jgi:hypothetical protein
MGAVEGAGAGVRRTAGSEGGRRVVILQPSYLPWLGHFDQLYKSDVFVLYDDVQYDKHGWRNRNRIKTANGPRWLTVPVLHRGNVERAIPIKEIQIDGHADWRRKHLLTIEMSYLKAPFFARYAPYLKEIYGREWTLLADLTIETTIWLARDLGLKTKFVRSSELGIAGDRNTRLVEILRHVGATHYITGPSASSYMDEGLFAAAGISIEYMAYSYPEYPQLHPPYDPQVSILDLLFMTGPDAGGHIWGGDHLRAD